MSYDYSYEWDGFYYEYTDSQICPKELTLKEHEKLLTVYWTRESQIRHLIFHIQSYNEWNGDEEIKELRYLEVMNDFKHIEELNQIIKKFKDEYGLVLDDSPKVVPINDSDFFKDDKNVHSSKTSTEGCYIATSVYGSYDCPEVWALRRFRDTILKQNKLGRIFVSGYYAISPTIVRYFGNYKLFKYVFKIILDKFVVYLKNTGLKDTKYHDQ